MATFRYPADVTKPPFDKWIVFSAMTGRHITRTMVGAEQNVPDIVLNSAVLYLPESALKQAQGVTWQDTELGPLAGKALELLAQSASDLADISWTTMKQTADEVLAGLKGVGSGVATTIKAGGLMEWAKTDIIAGLAAATGTGQGVNIATGQKANPRTDIYFDSQQYRSYNIEFMLVPRNRDEAIAIDNIIEFFQFYMLPSYKHEKEGKGAGFMMGYPYEFEIGIYSSGSELNHVGKIGRSVLKGVTIDHAAGGKVSFIRDDQYIGTPGFNAPGISGLPTITPGQGVTGVGQATGTPTHYPVATTLSLEFQEVRLLGRGDNEIRRKNYDFSVNDPRS